MYAEMIHIPRPMDSDCIIFISVSNRKIYQLGNFPVLFPGFTKCGTTDLFAKLQLHRLLKGGLMQKSNVTTTWGHWVDGKEAHFWDNMYFRRNSTLDFYTRLFNSETIVKSIVRYGSSYNNKRFLNNYGDLLYMDATPRTIWHGDTWHEDGINIDMPEPVALLPDKLHHVSPDIKIIVSMRNPTSRLFSDYIFYNGQTALDFHNKVMAAIEWWKTCMIQNNEHQKLCAYGKAPNGSEELGFEECIRNKTASYVFLSEQHRVCQTVNAWTKNAADRLRVGIYDIYLRDWLKVFDRHNFLFIKFEDYAKEPVEYIERYVLPFLGLPSYQNTSRQILQKSGISNKSGHRITMLPETKVLLDKFYAQTNRNLANLLQDDRFLWK